MGGSNSRWRNQNSRVIRQKILQSLKDKERDLFFRMMQRVSPERIVSDIGVNFRDLKSISTSNVTERCRSIREQTVMWQRRVSGGLDAFIAMRKMDIDMKELQKVFLGYAVNKKDPLSPAVKETFFGRQSRAYWKMYSDLGDVMLDLNRELGWFGRLPTRQKYASEWEVIGHVHSLLESDEGKLLLDHVNRCTVTPCRCSEAKNRLNILIWSAKGWNKDLGRQYMIFDTLIRENSNATKLGFIKAVADIYKAMETAGTIDQKSSKATEKRSTNSPN